MRLNYFAPVFLLAGAVALPAACTPACVPGKPTPASYTWNFRHEATQLLSDVQADAAQARLHADRLKSFANSPYISWQGHAAELAAIRKDVNDMGRRLCRLEMIRRVAAPWQREAIDHSAPLIVFMADNTVDAMNFLKQNEANFWVPAYEKYTANLYQESRQLSQSVNAFEEYAKVHRDDEYLEQALRLKAKA